MVNYPIIIIHFLEHTKKILESTRDILLKHDDMRVNLEFYSDRAKEGAVSALKTGAMCKMDTLRDHGLCGNFRKLEVD